MRLWLSALCVLTLITAPQRLLATPPTPPAALEPEALAAHIDQFLAARWNEKGVKPAPLVDDAHFLRRAYLDLAGRVPHVAELRDFLADKSADKRRRVVDTLLDSGLHTRHLASTWRDLMIPESPNPQVRATAATFQRWLAVQVRDNVPYDQIARELLIGPFVPAGRNGAVVPGSVRNPNATGPAVFYQANEFKAENLASSTSRIFLGVRLECAQCHDHPFASWKRTQFWEYAAFFGAAQPNQPRGGRVPPGGPQLLIKPNEIRIPGTDKVVQARFPDGTGPAGEAIGDVRTKLAEWVTSPANPYFARTAVNRLWGHFFGVGLMDPVDQEATEENPASHPELLDELAQQFVAHKYDVKYLIRAITATRAYRLASDTTDPNHKDARLFARMSVKGMTAEQLYDSLAAATGFRDQGPQNNLRVQFLGGGTARVEFLSRFASQDRRTEAQTSILQALALMNGKITAEATSLQRSRTLTAVAEAPFFDTAGRIETLYLAALARAPRAEERARLVAYVDGGGPRNDSRAALGDVFWALLNSSEFFLNH